MSPVRQFTGKITNPLRNADPAVHPSAAQVYTEERPYGPAITLDQPGGATAAFNDHHRFVVDAAADAATGNRYRKVQAVFDGDLYIDEDLSPDAADEDKVVRLALGVSMNTTKSLPSQLPSRGVTRTPAYAFYGNVGYASLGGAMTALGFSGDALTKFLDLAGVKATPKKVGMLPVLVGDVVGELGEITLDSGATGRALDFWLTMDPDGDVLYPDAFYNEVLRKATERLLHYQAGTSPDLEYDLQLSLWSVSQHRIVLRCNDEWNHPLGQYRAADLTLTRDDDTSLAWSYPVVPAAQVTGAVALAAWADGHATATLQARPPGQPGATLMLSTVPSSTAAAGTLSVPLRLPDPTSGGALKLLPTDMSVQALDPDDWFPAPGGTGWNPVAETSTTVTLPAPHAPARWTNGNTVTPLVDGHAYFTSLAEELDLVTNQTHYVCQAGWWIDHTFPLTQTYDPASGGIVPLGPDARTLGDHWGRIARLGASLFTLAWDSTGGPFALLLDALPSGGLRDFWSSIQDYGGAAQSFATALVSTQVLGVAYNPNAAAVAALNGLAGTGPHQAILDGRHRPMAAHHAKMVAIRNGRGLVAFVGGIDVNANRINSTRHFDYQPGTEPYHDVQCKLEGPAARDVLRTFVSRWNDHPPMPGLPDQYNGKTGDLFCTGLDFTGGTHQLLLNTSDDRVGGTEIVQVARTFGNCKGLSHGEIHQGGDFADDNGYEFAPDGDFTIEAAIIGAIRRAKRFVYIEDQFLGNMKVATVLAEKIAERQAALAADASLEEPFFAYILVPYFPNATKTATDLGLAAYLPDMLLKFARFLHGTSPAGPSLAGRVYDLLAKQEKSPDRFERVDPWGYTQTRWYDMLKSIDSAGKFWRMDCLRLPPYQLELELNTGRVGPDKDPPMRQRLDVGLEDRREYIHTKVTIVDDVWATIGSANNNVRSYTGDAEINCNYIDGRTDERGLRLSVRDLRRQLWADHLDMNIEYVPTEAANHPEVVKFWADRAVSVASQPASATEDHPSGSRVYQWPYDEVKVDIADPPGFSWSRNGAPVATEPYGITEIQMYWWAIEAFGKAPWAADASALMPPRIGSDRFAIDGDKAAAFIGFDLQPNPF